MSDELLNLDNKYIYFFVVEIVMIGWLIYKFRLFYR